MKTKQKNLQIELFFQKKVNDKNTKEKVKILIQIFKQKDNKSIFTPNFVDNLGSNYHEIVKNHMDLTILHDKINNNEYESLDDFKNDFGLMFDNYCLYFTSKSIIHEYVKALQILFQDMFSAVLNNQDLTAFYRYNVNYPEDISSYFLKSTNNNFDDQSILTNIFKTMDKK